MAARDKKVIDQTYKELEQISVYEKEFQEKEMELEKQAGAVRRAKVELLAAKRERERRLFKIRKEKEQTEKLVSELKARSEKMQSMLARLRADYQRQKTGMPAKHPDRAGGRLGYIDWPLRGRVVTNFGPHKHPKFNTTIFNRGVEIGSNLGSPVAAAQDGTVLFADVFEGYGQMVVLDHGSGYMTVYGHVSGLEVSVGQRVGQGQKLGEVGEAGISSVPTLYFEVREQGKPLNPLRFLRR
jgi:septal ring factor EnvC (AmiA/AmiB activator)